MTIEWSAALRNRLHLNAEALTGWGPQKKIGMGLILTALLLFIRNPYVVIEPQFWHEDALIFLNDQRMSGYPAIFQPYAGYLHLIPRLVAALAGCLPLEITPQVYLAASYCGWLCTGAIVLTSPLFSSFRWALFATLVGLAIPQSGEVMVNLTNLQWGLGTGLALLVAEPTGARRGPLPLVFICLAGLTGPFSIILAPVALWQITTDLREKRINLKMLALLLSGATQLVVLFSTSTRLQQANGADWSVIALILGTGIFPEYLGTQLVFPQDLLLRLIGTGAGIGGLLWSIRPEVKAGQSRRLLLITGSLLLLASVFSCVSSYHMVPRAFGAGARYLYAPFALFSWALVSTWSFAAQTDRTKFIGIALLVSTLVHSATNFIAPKYGTPDWREVSRLIREGNTLEVGVPPFGRTFTLGPVKK